MTPAAAQNFVVVAVLVSAAVAVFALWCCRHQWRDPMRGPMNLAVASLTAAMVLFSPLRCFAFQNDWVVHTIGEATSHTLCINGVLIAGCFFLASLWAWAWAVLSRTQRDTFKTMRRWVTPVPLVAIPLSMAFFAISDIDRLGGDCTTNMFGMPDHPDAWYLAYLGVYGIAAPAMLVWIGVGLIWLHRDPRSRRVVYLHGAAIVTAVGAAASQPLAAQDLTWALVDWALMCATVLLLSAALLQSHRQRMRRWYTEPRPTPSSQHHHHPRPPSLAADPPVRRFGGTPFAYELDGPTEFLAFARLSRWQAPSG